LASERKGGVAGGADFYGVWPTLATTRFDLDQLDECRQPESGLISVNIGG
jgi:hypothetical protein